MAIKFLSINIWLGGALQEALLDFLKQQDADIVVMQEVYNGTDASSAPQYRSMEIFKERLNYPYQHFVPDYLDINQAEGKAHRGNAVLSKFPIAETSAIYLVPYSEEYMDVPGNFHNCPRDLQHVVIDTPDGQLNVFNIQGVWDMDGDNDSPARRDMVAKVVEAVEGKQNVILAGDTNATPGNEALEPLNEALHNVFGSDLKSTFNMRRKDNPGYATAAVDMIYVSPNIKVLSRECLDVDISDHLPVIATLQMN